MFRRALRSVFSVHYAYSDPIAQQRARVLLVISLSIVFAAMIWVIVGSAISVISPETPNFATLETLLIPFISLIVYGLIQHGNLILATWAFVLAMMIGPLISISTGIDTTAVISIMLPLIAAGALLPRNGVIAIMIVLMVLAGMGYYIQLGNTELPSAPPSAHATIDLIYVVFALGVSAMFMIAFNVQSLRSLESNQSRLHQYEAIARLSSEIQAPTLHEDDAIRHALTRAVETMGVAYAQMFITDAGGSIKRRVRTAFGQNLTTRVDEEALLGDTNIVYQAARNRITMTATLQSPEMRRRHFLASTRASAAVPVLLNDELLGVLDFQIETASDFTDIQLKTFEMLAAVVAAAVESQRGRRAMQAALKQAQDASHERDGQQLYSQRSVNQAYWNTLFQPDGESAIGFDLDTMRKAFVESKDLAPTLRQTLSQGKTHIDERPDGSFISVPIMIGQQVLGAMSFQLPHGRTLSKRQTELVETIAERLALALENRRLFEQSRTQAERERKANDIARMLLSATEIDMVLRIAADNFNNALGAINTEIHVQTTPQTSMEQSEETVS